MKRWMRILKSITCVLACMMLFGSVAFASELPAEGEELHYVDVSENVIKLGGLFETAEEGYVPAPPKMMSALPDPLDTTYGLRCSIRDAILNQEESILIAAYALNLDKLRDIYAQVLNENPELVNATGSFSWGGSSSSLVTTLYPKYSQVYTRENVDELKAKALAIVEGMSSTFTDEQKILYLHDYLVTHCQYDTDTLALYNQYTPQEIVNLELGKFNAYNALIEGTAVCQGYSEAMVLLGNYANLDIRLVTSDANNHAWNMINLDDVWYFFDSTWDDPTSDNGYLYPVHCRHINLLRSRDGLVGTGHVGTDWTNDKLGNVYGYATDSEKYDSYYWMNTTSAIPILGDTCAYAKEGVFGKVYLRKTDNSEQEITASALKYWKVWNGGGDYYPTTNFACFAAYGDSFYFSTPTEIFRLGTDGTLEKVHELSASAVGYIYGIQAGATGIDYWVGVEYKECEYVKGTKEIELTDPELKITNVSLVLQDNLAINFIAPKEPFDTGGYGTPYAVFNVNGNEKTVQGK
ncbi:MAG: hypothetical protein IKO41_11145, partial [Lachnospiraceae bacterium]|nr:hypothetical protein [Lachnospiraceae bacterium]